MNIDEIFKISGAILASVGGAAAIFFGLSSWLGKVWAERILGKEKAILATQLESYKHEHAKVLEEEKYKYSMILKDYEVQIESLKNILLRYSERQFDIYGELWVSLCNLKKAMDELWVEVSTKKVREFSSQLNEAKFYLEKSSLFVDDEHLNKIHQALYQLDEFAHGKGELMQFIGQRDTSTNNERRNIIDNNRHRKEIYDQMLKELRAYFKSKISGA
ncbi:MULTISPECIES: hypothetical protein [unclassified Sulfuricurvum]|uniref:hypothetical protein n=1 Tax=unclassified Sulfuricurvum TaxID=2632390 RepID=UPI0025D67741|nr:MULTISPECIES: hypothetical protein [unclassified Sulfuricurvum]